MPGISGLFETVNNSASMPVDRAAGELEGARPTSNTINRRPKTLAVQVFSDNSILPEAKYSAAEAPSKKSATDFFDKLKKT